MDTPDFAETGPPSDREREDQWRRNLYGKLDSISTAVSSIRTCLYALVTLAVVALFHFW